MALTEEKNIPAEEPIDIDLSVTRRKNFRINGDNNRIVSLNTSDMGIFARLNDEYPKLKQLSLDAQNLLPDEFDTEDGAENAVGMLAKLRDIDAELRAGVDYIFDSNVCEVCAPDGTLYDPFDGKFRFEHIIEVLTGLYEGNLTSEFKKMTARINKHTGKYTKKK